MKLEDIVAASELIKHYKELTKWTGSLGGYRPVIEWGELRFEITQEEADLLLKKRVDSLADSLKQKGIEI